MSEIKVILGTETDPLRSVIARYDSPPFWRDAAIYWRNVGNLDTNATLESRLDRAHRCELRADALEQYHTSPQLKGYWVY